MKKNSILPLILLIGSCISCSKGINYSVEEYRSTMKFHDNFKVMQLTDLHLGVESDLAKQLKFISNSIEHADPDLIVLTGDNFMYGSKGIVRNLIYTLNEKCKELTASHPERLTKFAITFGNHDNQGDYHRYFINETILKYVTKDGNETKDHKYAAFLDYENDNLFGFTNYFIDLVDDQNKSNAEVDVKYRIHIIDSNTYYYVGPKYKYDVIHDDQLEHVNNIYKTATADKDYIGLAFFHIPFYQFEEMKIQYKEAEDPSKIGQGEFLEGVADGYTDNGAFRKLRDANIVSYFVGHDHINYCDVIYNADATDIMDKAIFSYGVKSTNQLYHEDVIMGYKLINLKDNMTNESFLSIDYIKENFINVIDRGDLYE